MSDRAKENRTSAWIIGVNLFLVCCTVIVFSFYTAGYRDKLKQQNIADISNINRSAANISSAFFLNQQKRLADAVRYIGLQRFGSGEVLAYIRDSNSDTGRNYELVGADGRGYAVPQDGTGFIPVDYSGADYRELQKIFAGAQSGTDSGIRCTQEFTDQYTAFRSFALYDRLILPGDETQYTLMAVFNSSDFNGLIELNGGYREIATVLMNRSGDYVLGSADFKSDNLFRYFYDFNDLSLDQRNQDAGDFASGGKNIFYYKNSKGELSIFVCTEVPDTQWYAVTCVPLSSFHSTAMDMGFILWLIALLLIMMGFNVFWMNRANRKLRESVQRETEASAAKTDFLSRMSHDIRTPLNVILGSVVLAGKEDNPAETRKYLNNIGQSGKFLLSLVNDILDLNKVEAGKMELYPEPYSLRKLKDSLEAIIGPLCREKGITFRTDGCDGDQSYLLDPVRTDQIFLNLLSNSVKFTPAGGHVGLECVTEETGDGAAELKFRVYDDGRGMGREFQAHMFEAFSQEQQTAGPELQGTGLGLAIVGNLVKLMHGTLRVESEPGRGTVFFIAVPARKSDGICAAETEQIVSADVLSGRKVLLFEDNRINAEIAEKLLADRGMSVTCAADGKSGLALFTESREGYYDLILMDMRMPVMNGMEATRAIRALPRPDAAGIPIIAMTANAYDVDVKNCLAAGMNAHISKPIDPDKMYAVLARFLTPADGKQTPSGG